MSISQEQYDNWRASSDAHFKERIENVSNRSYEYGVLVIKNAFLVAGGGLFLTPALAQVTKTPNVECAAYAGVLFACAVLCALLANYITHLNWMFHENVWEAYWRKDRIELVQLMRDLTEEERNDLSSEKSEIEKQNGRIGVSFWAIHLLGVCYVGFFVAACYHLYQSLGVNIS